MLNFIHSFSVNATKNLLSNIQTKQIQMEQEKTTEKKGHTTIYNRNIGHFEVKKEVANKLLNCIEEILSGTEGMSEEEKSDYIEKIIEKLHHGKKLSEKELNYLRANNPELYVRVKRVQMQREILEKQLKNCRTKKEAKEAYSTAVESIQKEDPDGEMLRAAYQDAMKEFKKTVEYQTLPEDKIEKDSERKRWEKVERSFDDMMYMEAEMGYIEHFEQMG